VAGHEPRDPRDAPPARRALRGDAVVAKAEPDGAILEQIALLDIAGGQGPRPPRPRTMATRVEGSLRFGTFARAHPRPGTSSVRVRAALEHAAGLTDQLRAGGIDAELRKRVVVEIPREANLRRSVSISETRPRYNPRRMSDLKTTDLAAFDLFNPTDEHRMLRRTLREFVEREVEPQALEHDRTETFNHRAFPQARRDGPPRHHRLRRRRRSGMDPVGTVLVHEELSSSDAGFCLAYLAHTLLFVNNFYRNSNDEQRKRVLDKVVSGEWIGGSA